MAKGLKETPEERNAKQNFFALSDNKNKETPPNKFELHRTVKSYTDIAVKKLVAKNNYSIKLKDE